MSEPISRLRCISCGANYKTEQVRYRCDCGDLLEVIHDLDQIRSRYPDLKERFAQRLTDFSTPYVSGVWRYHESVFET
jgi:threonine synthase